MLGDVLRNDSSSLQSGMKPNHASHHHQPSFSSLQAPCCIDHFARFEESLSPSTFIDIVRDRSTALVVGQRSPRFLLSKLDEYVGSSDISFYQVLEVSAESVAQEVKKLFSELNFRPPSPTFEQLVNDIVSDVSHFSEAIASPIVELSIILQDRIDDQEEKVELGPEDLEADEMIGMMWDRGLVHHLDMAGVNQIKIYSGPSTYYLDPSEIQLYYDGEYPESWVYQLSKETFYRSLRDALNIDDSRVVITLDEIYGFAKPAQMGDFGDNGVILHPIQFIKGIGHLFFGAKQQFVDAGYNCTNKCLFHTRPSFADTTESRRFLTIVTSPKGYLLPLGQIANDAGKA
jgi:hypothetical protein